jgi:hypothetical protein
LKNRYFPRVRRHCLNGYCRASNVFSSNGLFVEGRIFRRITVRPIATSPFSKEYCTIIIFYDVKNKFLIKILAEHKDQSNYFSWYSRIYLEKEFKRERGIIFLFHDIHLMTSIILLRLIFEKLSVYHAYDRVK